MKKDFIIDYSGYILIRLLGPLIRSLPLNVSFFLGRRLGDLLYYFDGKHKAVAYANIKTAFTGKLSPAEISNLTKEFYRVFGQNILEVLLIPLMDKAYLNKYITLEGKEFISEGFHKGRGVILLCAHEGSWELSNLICANLGFPFNLFIRQQRCPRLNKLLNLYRKQRGCRIIQKENQIRDLIRALKSNEAIGMMVDQGGKTGIRVKFFGKDASMASGAVRFALKYGAAIIPVFYTRIKGPAVKLFFAPPFELKRTGNLEKDIADNLQRLTELFQGYILKYPQEYLWYYKLWKYSREREILILDDGKTGHLRQSQALARTLNNCLKDNGITTNIETKEIKFKNRISRFLLTTSSCLAGRYRCQGCLWCLSMFLREDVYKSLTSIKPDFVISSGSSVAPINYVISRENLAQSIVIMRPSVLSTKRFNLVVMSRHDQPPRRKNVLVTEGALNLIDENYLREHADRLLQLSVVSCQLLDFCIGLLIGGDTKTFHLKEDTMSEVISQIKSAAEKWDASILITTSRRTSGEIVLLLKKEFGNYPRCKLLILANEKNIPQAVGGILSLSKIVLTSPESISMISEAANSKRYVLVFNSADVGTRHRRFLEHFAKNKYIYLVKPGDLGKKIEEVWLNKPEINTLKDNLKVADAIRKII